MQRTFLQEKSLNRSLDNAEKSLNVDLSAKSKLIPYSTAADMVGLNDLYLQERDACENYRMIFTVNPICTNVLYNAVTEPVYKEGSLSALTLVETAVRRNNTYVFPEGTMNQSGDTVDQLGAVRDTEYSHERIGDFKYHCGYDIFNNHLLRTEDFEHVRMENDGTNKEQFNTLFDFAIDYSGKTVTRVLGESDGPFKGLPAERREKVRMYQLDNIKSINKAFYDGLRSVDGWYGFYNTGYINIPNGKLKDEEVSLNKILNNEAPCGFIDMYPDRSLYSFIPKVNRYKKRIERNWDCGIVYPYKSDEDMFNRVMINFTGSDEDWTTWKTTNQSSVPNAVRVLETRVVYNNVGDEMLEMHSLLRHTLQPGDEIRLFYTVSDYTTGKIADCKQIYRFSRPVKIVGAGDVNGNNEDRVFAIKQTDVRTFCGVVEYQPDPNEKPVKKAALIEPNGSAGTQFLTFFYRKVENGCDDRYYFRKFKELKDYEYVELKNCDSYTGCTDEEKAMWEAAQTGYTQLINEPTVITEKSPDYIKLGNDYFIKVAKPLAYTQNKIAFAENIFGDRVAQVIFNDDICVSGLKDNLGRPLSTVYFTAIKTNRGHKEWYNSGITSADTVEFSHCFGEITSGLDLPWNSAATDFNVRKLNNVFSGECQEKTEYLDGLMLALEDRPVGNYTDGTPIPLESGITLDDFDEFYGDIVEFSKANFMETTIEKVYHRFNTAQRECLLNKKYYDIHYDELTGDLFDVK